VSSFPDGFRIGSVPYLNARPLVYGLEGRLVEKVPSLLADDFTAGRLDAALLPFFAVLQAGGGKVVDDVAIACRGAVYSVFVASREKFEDSGRIHLDPASRSSSALLRVLLAEFYRGSHCIVEVEEMPEDAPHLLIGDPAIAFRRSHAEGWHFHDLGALWEKQTGLPFVFAVWATTAPMADDLRRVKAAGLAAREEIAAREKDPAFALEYLTDHIRYDIGSDEKKAMLLFETLARRHGVLPAGEMAKVTFV